MGRVFWEKEVLDNSSLSPFRSERVVLGRYHCVRKCTDSFRIHIKVNTVLIEWHTANGSLSPVFYIMDRLHSPILRSRRLDVTYFGVSGGLVGGLHAN